MQTYTYIHIHACADAYTYDAYIHSCTRACRHTLPELLNYDLWVACVLSFPTFLSLPFFSSTDFHNCKHLAQFFYELAVAACRGCGTQTMRASDLAALCAISNCIFTMCIQRAADASRLAWKPRSRLWKPRSRLMKQKPKKRRVSQMQSEHGQGEKNVALVLSAAFAQTHPQL